VSCQKVSHHRLFSELTLIHRELVLTLVSCIAHLRTCLFWNVDGNTYVDRWRHITTSQCVGSFEGVLREDTFDFSYRYCASIGLIMDFQLSNLHKFCFWSSLSVVSTHESISIHVSRQWHLYFLVPRCSTSTERKTPSGALQWSWVALSALYFAPHSGTRRSCRQHYQRRRNSSSWEHMFE
jgi:hypothetical protein